MAQNFWRGKRVFITGHTGFKGAWLAFWLREIGAEVAGFSLAPNTDPNLFSDLQLGSNIHHQTGDIRDADKLTKAVKNFQPDVLFHLAAQALVAESYSHPVDTYSTNVMGTMN